MEHREGSFRGCRNLSLYYQCWLPDEEVKCVLLVVHGITEHSGRYTNLAEYFVPRGYAVYCLDHQGHGQSEGVRGYVDRFGHYISDLKTFSQIVQSRHNESKIFMVGHSMGGLIAMSQIHNLFLLFWDLFSPFH